MRKPDCKICRTESRNDFLSSAFGKCTECQAMNKYKAHLISMRKFTEGDTIKDISELLNQEWCLCWGKGKHIEAVKNMQLSTVLKWLEAGFFKKAIRKDKQK